MSRAPGSTNPERDEEIYQDRQRGMRMSAIAKKHGVSVVRVHAIIARVDREFAETGQGWELDLREAADKLLRAIIRVGLRRVYYPRDGEPDGIPDMPPDDIRARARELGLLR